MGREVTSSLEGNDIEREWAAKCEEVFGQGEKKEGNSYSDRALLVFYSSLLPFPRLALVFKFAAEKLAHERLPLLDTY